MKRVINIKTHLRKGRPVRTHRRWLVIDSSDRVASGIAGQSREDAQSIADRLNRVSQDKSDSQYKYHKGKTYRVEDVEVV